MSLIRWICAASVLLLAVAPAGGDPLGDLGQVLQRFPARTPFGASLAVQVNGGSEGNVRTGVAKLEVDFNAAGFALRMPPDQLEAAQSEAAGKKRDPNSATPTRTAIVALTMFDVLDTLDAAAMLLDELSGATFLGQSATVRDGKPATLLRLKVKPTLATKSRFVNEPKIDLRVWINGDGIPFAVERDSDYSASFLFIKGGNLRKERWDLAVRGDRLYATRYEANERASAAGRTMDSSKSVLCSPR